MLFHSSHKLRRFFSGRVLFNKLRDYHLTSTVCPSALVYKYNHCFKGFVTFQDNGALFKRQNQIEKLNCFKTGVSGKCTCACSQSGDAKPDVENNEMISVTFVTSFGKVIEVKANVGENVLDLSRKHNVGAHGTCDKNLACSTCHMYVDESYLPCIEGVCTEYIVIFNMDINNENNCATFFLSEKKEEDLLEITPFLKENSRLTCQIELTKEMDGIRFALPEATVNHFTDGNEST